MGLALSPLVAFLALIIERVVGYPDILQRRIGHPVQWQGALVSWLDRALNRPSLPPLAQRLRGAMTVAAVISVTFAIAVPLTLALRVVPLGWLLEAVLATCFLAQHSLLRFVGAVADGLDRSLDEGRRAVSHIVGRDPQALDASGVARGAIESLAENSSDGVVAPAFWLLLFGLPGIAAYKAINTLDSMIGHRSERYLHFGWAAARLDDLVNLPASRLCGLLIAVAAGLRRPHQGLAAWRVMLRDARKHLSPNAGWPESAMAGALGIRLGGPRAYGGRTVELAWMGSGRTGLDQADIERAMSLARGTFNLIAVAIGAVAAVILLV